MRNECSVIVTHRCNNTCLYCDVPARQAGARDCTLDSIARHSGLITRKFDRIALSGGEPGLLDERKVGALLDIGVWRQVNTNGTFISRGLWDTFKGRIDKLHYHCVQELTDDVEHVLRDKSVEYTFVLHAKNAHLVDDFLARHKDIKQFHVKPFALKNDAYDLSLSPDNVREAIEACERHGNKCVNLKKFLLGIEAPEAAKEFLRDNCAAKTPSIDLVTEQARACTTKDLWSLALTEDAIDMINKKGRGGVRCGDCDMPLRHTSTRDILDALRRASK